MLKKAEQLLIERESGLLKKKTTDDLKDPHVKCHVYPSKFNFSDVIKC